MYRQRPTPWHLPLHPSTVECVLPLKPVEGVVVPRWPKEVASTSAALGVAGSNTGPPGSGQARPGLSPTGRYAVAD